MASKMANGSFKMDCPAFKMANGIVYQASRMANGSFGMVYQARLLETNELANHNSISVGLVHMAFKMANGMVYRASRMANGSFGMVYQARLLETNELANHNSISMGFVHMASINGKPTKVLQTALKRLANGDNKPTRWLQGDCLVYGWTARLLKWQMG